MSLRFAAAVAAEAGKIIAVDAHREDVMTVITAPAAQR
jgi:hypothetical protein